MRDSIPVDTDIILKVSAYRCATELKTVFAPKGSLKALGLVHLIAEKQLSRKQGLRDLEGARAELKHLLSMLGTLEPNEAEIELAADLSAMARDQGLPLDVGEAQLVAIVVGRKLPLLVTGDKRAIGAIAALVGAGSVQTSLVGRLVCLEQVIIMIASLIGESALRVRVCAEPEADTGMQLACSCGRDPWDPRQLHEACASFLAAVRNRVGSYLIEDSLLT